MTERLRILKSASEVMRSDRESRQTIVADGARKTQAKTVYPWKRVFIRQGKLTFVRVLH